MLHDDLAYGPARALPELVGRDHELKQIGDTIRDTENSYIVYITGAGGLGKTRLIEHVLKHLPVAAHVIKASDVIDLYHTQTHSLAGLVDEIQSHVEPLDLFFRSEIEHAGEDRLRPIVMAEHEGFTQAELLTRRREFTAYFLATINRFTTERRLVLALDTAERLHQSDYAQQTLGLTDRPVILDWLLKELLPCVNNVVFLIAGRPGRGNLQQALEQVPNKRVVTIDLPGLTEKYALEYFDAVGNKATTSNDPHDRRVAEAIQLLSKEQRQTAFYCLCETHDSVQTVRPILLALAIDHLAVATPDEILSVFSMPLADAQTLTDAQRKENQEELGRALIDAIQNSRHPSGDVIKALSWLGKGGDVDLLSRLAGLSVQMVEKTLDNMRDLSFIKVRPRDRRIFLHDEVLDLIRRRVRVTDARRDTVYQTIVKYYQEQIDNARTRIAGLYESSGETALPHPAEVIQARAELQNALVEDLHYRLLHQPSVGFETYFRYAEEAISASDEGLDMQLRAELLGLLERQDLSGTEQEIHGLRRADITADAAVRCMKRLIDRGRYSESLEIARKLRGEAKELLEGGGPLAQAELDTWEGIALTYIGKFQEAEPLLERAVQISESSGNPSSIRWNGIQARAYNNLGYFARDLGQVLRAAQAYRNALPRWRYLEMESEHANTLNNLAYVLALQGKFAEARRQGKDALDLREKVGPRAPVVLSLTTLAEIEIYAGHYSEARDYAEKGLALSQILNNGRGEGFARLALAALTRFQAEPEQTRNEHDRQALLQQSLEQSQKALEIFTKVVVEPRRATRARYEQALTLREQCRLLDKFDPKRIAITERANALFEQVAVEAKRHERWDEYLDARLGQVWMYHHLKNLDRDQFLDQIGQEIQVNLLDYVIQPMRWPVVIPAMVLGVFSQLARYHIIRGILALDDQNDRRKAGQQFALGFEYDRFIGEDFRDLNRGINVVHNRLRGFNSSELVKVFDGVASILGTLMPQSIMGRIKQKEDLMFWQVLESHFGSYEVLRQQVH